MTSQNFQSLNIKQPSMPLEEDGTDKQPILQSNTKGDRITLIIADDQHFVRKMLEHSLALQADFEIVGLAQNGAEAIDLVRRYQPDIALVDVEMPDINGLAVTQTLVQEVPQTKVLVLSIHDDDNYIRSALEIGARGYLLKNTPAEELAHAIRFVNRGYLQLGPGLFEKLEGVESNSIAINPLSSSAMTPSPVEDLELLAEPSLQEWTDVTQDLVNTLPQVWSRGLVYVFLLFVVGLIPWSYFTRLDEVVVTQGTLAPKGQTIRLDAPVEAKVINIFVQEGEQVKANQPLIEFQSDQVETELQQTQALLSGQINQLSQQELLKNQILASIQVQNQQFQAQSLEKQAQVTQAEQALDASTIRTPIQLSEKFAQVEQAIAALNSAKRKVQLIDSSYQAELEEVQRYKSLLNQGAIPSIQLVEAQRRASEIQRQKSDAQAEVALAQKRLQEQRRSHENLKQQLKAEKQQAKTRVDEQLGGKATLRHSGDLAISQSREQLKDVETRITELASQITQSRNQIKALQAQQKQRIVYAPKSGTVFQLPIQHPGAVVRPGQLVTQLAPNDAKLVLRGVVPNKDIGLMKVGLPVKLKFDSFPFENFGLVAGQVSWISPNGTATGQETSDSANPSGGNNSGFTIEVSLDQSFMETSDQKIPFKAGQSASAEIVVRQRRVVDLFLDPFLEFQKGSGSI